MLSEVILTERKQVSMMKRKMVMMLCLLPAAVIIAGAGCTNLTKMATRDVPRIEPSQLAPLIKKQDVSIIDIRLARNWEESSKKIEGARREVADEFPAWESKYAKDKTVVLYCACPAEATSARVAQHLIGSYGFKEVYALKGGWRAWEEGNYPTESKEK